MTDKISCPTLNVVLVKAIRALCEVTIKFDHTLEITGSLHIRSDGDKVLTCLLNEDCIKSPVSPHLNDIALKLNLVNAALALNNIGVIHSNNNNNNGTNHNPNNNNNTGGNNNNNNNTALSQVANDSLRNLALQQNISIKNQNLFSVDAFTSRPLAVLSVADGSSNNANNSNAASNMLATNVNPFIINQIISPGDNNTNIMGNNNNVKISKNVRATGGGTRCKKRVDTVARTLANIKNDQQQQQQQQQQHQQTLDYNNQIDAPIKLPDIQTLAHRLPSYEVATGDLDAQGQKFKVKSPGAVTMVTLKHSPSSIKKENNGSQPMEDSKLDAKLLNATSQQQQKGQNRVKKFQCMFCGIFLSTKCYLKNHVNAMHTRLHVYKCDLCEHSFYSAGAMRIHKLRNHWIDSKKHRCSECNESFLLPIELRKHIQKRHGNIGGGMNVALTNINNNNNFINSSNNNNNSGNSLTANNPNNTNNNTLGNNVSVVASSSVVGNLGMKSGFSDSSNNNSNNGFINVNNNNNNEGFDFSSVATSMNSYSLATDNNNNNFQKNINDYLAMNAGIINYTTINNSSLVEVPDFNNNNSSSINNNNNNNIDDHNMNNNMIDNNTSGKKGAVNLTINSDEQMLSEVEQMKIEPQDQQQQQQHELANKKRTLSSSSASATPSLSSTASLSSTPSLQNYTSTINGPS